MEKYTDVIKVLQKQMDANDLHSAIAGAHTLLSTYPDEFNVKYCCGGILIDAGTGINDQTIINEGIQIFEQLLVDDNLDIQLIIQVEYNLSNGYGSLGTLFSQLGQSDQSKEAYHRQKAILQHVLLNINALDENLASYALTNYANLLDHLDRTIESVDHFYDCLKINPKHAVAKANCGVALQGLFDIAGDRQRTLLYEAWQLLSDANSNPAILARIAGPYALATFQQKFQDIEELINKHQQGGTAGLQAWAVEKCKSHVGQEPTPLQKQWHDKHLFLNVYYGKLDCPSDYRDDAFFHQMHTPVEDIDDHYFRNLVHMLNQIKEDYALARYFYFLAETDNPELIATSAITLYGGVYDYTEFGIRPGLLKTSIRVAVDVLDKIAVFLNDYLNLGHQVHRVTFEKIWFENLNKDKKILNPIISDLLNQNRYLRALQDLSRDWLSKVYPGPLKDIRNASTHRHVVLSWLPVNASKTSIDTSYTLDQFRSLVLQNLRSTKAAILYLIGFIKLCEQRKANESTRLTVPLLFDLTPSSFDGIPEHDK